ncbi:hypothetical protein OC844_007364 [Tilletia horrida]|nr:hypothetical protein OC844_007364 [Tilletia horrida]
MATAAVPDEQASMPAGLDTLTLEDGSISSDADSPEVPLGPPAKPIEKMQLALESSAELVWDGIDLLIALANITLEQKALQRDVQRATPFATRSGSGGIRPLRADVRAFALWMTGQAGQALMDLQAVAEAGKARAER